MKKRKVWKRSLRRTGALCLAAVMSLSMFGTGTVLADATDVKDADVETVKVSTEDVVMPVSAEFICSEEIVFYEGIDSHITTDDAGYWYQEYYSPFKYKAGLAGTDSQIVITYDDGSTTTYTVDDYGTFRDENGHSLSIWDVTSVPDQSLSHWEVGESYYFTALVGSYDYPVQVEIPVTIAENPNSAVFVSDQESLVVYQGIDSEEREDYDNDEMFDYYDFWGMDFTNDEKIIITLEDGTEEIYTVVNEDGDFMFYDEDGNYLDMDVIETQYTNHWDVGGTYSFDLSLPYGITLQIPVTVAANPYADATVQAVFQNPYVFTLTFGADTWEEYYYEWDNETGMSTLVDQYSYYNLYGHGPTFTEGDRIIITTEEESITYTADADGEFRDAEGNELYYGWEYDQDENHWEIGKAYEIVMILSDYGLEIPATVRTQALPFAAAQTMTAGSSYTANITTVGDYALYAITPASSGSYQFYLDSEDWTDIYILDASQNVVAYAEGEEYFDDGDEGFDEDYYTYGRDAHFSVDLKKGITYYVLCRYDRYSGVQTGSFTVYANQLTSEGDEDIAISASDVTLASTSLTYTGSAQTPAVTVKVGGTTLTAGTHYTVSYANNTNAGTASVTVTGKNGYTGTISKTFTITKATQSITVKKANKTIKASKLKKKKQSVKAIKKVTGAQGTVTYSKVKGKNASKFTVNKKTGKITVKKGTKKGTYKVKIKVSASGNSNYEAASKTITVKIKVK